MLLLDAETMRHLKPGNSLIWGGEICGGFCNGNVGPASKGFWRWEILGIENGGGGFRGRGSQQLVSCVFLARKSVLLEPCPPEHPPFQFRKVFGACFVANDDAAMGPLKIVLNFAVSIGGGDLGLLMWLT